MGELEPAEDRIIEPSINPLGDKRSNRDLDGELQELQNQQTDIPQPSRQPRQRRYSAGMPLVDIIGVEACEELATDLGLGEPIKYLRPRRPRLHSS